MALILGKEYCKVDSNGRFKFPIALKRQLESEDGRFVIRQSVYAECLELWTYASFREEVEKLQGMLNPYRREDRDLLRKLTEGNIIELDSNDRLLVPTEQKSVIAKAKEIVLQSTGKFIELWSREAYEKMNNSNNDFALKAEELLGRVLPLSEKGQSKVES
ncbi:MAG: division/cell wall cluster transcriptional repressor MraZ [bacterium]